MKTIIKISVRDLVDFVLRSGDLVSSFSGRSRALEGTKAHQKLQKSQPAAYRPEVSLVYTAEMDDFVIEIGGRADGILEQDGLTLIDEIKSTDAPLDNISELDNPLYWAQAKCYAFMYSHQQSLEQIDVQLTYYQLTDKTCKRFRSCFSSSELMNFFTDLVSRYLQWLQKIRLAQAERDTSVRQLQFPFSSYRPGQRELAVAVYRSIAAHKRLYAQAPTGIGKTLATLFPAIKAIGEGKIEKIFYATAKSSTQDIAEQTLAFLRTKDLLIKAITITAKDKICFCPGTDCDPEYCTYAKGHYDRIYAALSDIYGQPVWSRSIIEQYAKKHHVCPFEFSLDLAIWADCVICDYNYIFDPTVSLKRFFSEASEQFCLLIDEAHNLTERAREMYSACLAQKQLKELRQVLKQAQPKLAKALSGILTCLNRWGKLCAQNENLQYIQQQLPEEVIAPAHKFLKAADGWLAKNQPAPFKEQLLQAYFAVHAFIRTAGEFGDNYVFYAEKNNGDTVGKLFCLDPSPLLRKILVPGRAAIFFSATLAPLDYYKDTLSGETEDVCLTVDSPFPRNNLCVLAEVDIATTYSSRASSYDSVAAAVKAVTTARSGNYLVFFPSYRYLDEVAARYNHDCDTVFIRQHPAMTDAERDEFLACFSNQPAGTLVGFAVLGGAFGEGIDLIGERLCGAVIVGVGLPQVALERNLIRAYYQTKNEMGFEYAYLYPGINKVLQAAGRVIRSDNDKGIVLLIDERYSQPRCRRLLPHWWQPLRTVRGVNAIRTASREFWS